MSEVNALVFLTVGNATQGFERLLRAADDAAGNGIFGDEPVFMQTGNNPDFRAVHCQQESFVEMHRFELLLRDASLVISHGGSGTLIKLLQNGKVPIVMPRRRQYSEHVDDHQVELVKALAAEGRVIPVYEPEDLEVAVKSGKSQKRQQVAAPPSQMISLVSKAIEEIRQRQS